MIQRIFRQGMTIAAILVLVACAAKGSAENDKTAAVLSDGQPVGSIASGTRETTISVKTNEDATCKYSITTTRVEYEQMPHQFENTGKKIHSSILKGLSDGQSYNLYVRCKDLAGNVNQKDFPISFQVAVSGNSGELKKILFIGNSLTGHSGGVQNHLQKMMEESGFLIEVAGEIHGGESFSYVNENYPGLINIPEVSARIKSNDWDAIILQGYGLAESEEQFIKSGGILIDRVRANGSNPVLFMIWGRREHPEQDTKQRQRYERLGKIKNVFVVPIAAGIRAAHDAKLDVFADGEHLNLKGAYLAAAMYYAFFTHKSPVGLKFDGFVGSGYFGRLTTQELLSLQIVAWKIISDSGVYWDNR